MPRRPRAPRSSRYSRGRDGPAPMPSAPPDLEPLDTTTEIETPEHVYFRYAIAGPARRGLAYLLDLLVRGVIALAAVFLGSIASFADVDKLKQASTGVQLLLLFALEWGYYVFFEVTANGRTPGKRALGLRVVTEGGSPLRFTDSFLRNLLRAADFLPMGYAVGLVVMGADARFRRLGDLAGGTLVVVEERRAVVAPFRIEPAATPAELRSIPQRLPLSADEREAITLFLRRSERLSPARAAELAEMVAPIFARRIDVRYRDPVRFLGLLHHRLHGALKPRARERGARAARPA
jgi:uncharacterized RDD family membrane protein YckC